MRAEHLVPLEERYLELASRVSAKVFESEKAQAIVWCRQHPERLDATTREALARLEATTLSDTTLAFIQYASYADIPPGRTFDTAFLPAEPTAPCVIQAVLRGAIFFGRLPTLGLEHGHHHLVVFDFPHGAPGILANLRVDVFDGGMTPPVAALCDHATWRARHARD